MKYSFKLLFNMVCAGNSTNPFRNNRLTYCLLKIAFFVATIFFLTKTGVPHSYLPTRQVQRLRAHNLSLVLLTNLMQGLRRNGNCNEIYG